MNKKKLLNLCLAGLLGVGLLHIVKTLIKYIMKLADKSYRMEEYASMFDKWLTMRESGRKVEEYLLDNDMHTVGIYGMGNLGVHLLHDLQNLNSVKVMYGVDRSVERVNEEIVIYKPEDILPEVDLIIVTAIFSYDEIESLLQKKLSCPIISLNKFIEEI